MKSCWYLCIRNENDWILIVHCGIHLCTSGLVCQHPCDRLVRHRLPIGERGCGHPRKQQGSGPCFFVASFGRHSQGWVGCWEDKTLHLLHNEVTWLMTLGFYATKHAWNQSLSIFRTTTEPGRLKVRDSSATNWMTLSWPTASKGLRTGHVAIWSHLTLHQADVLRRKQASHKRLWKNVKKH